MTPSDPIPFSPPDITQEDIDAVVEVLKSGWITTGPVSEKFAAGLADFCGTEGAVLQSSCTSGLETLLRAAGVGPGDEVLVPAYTYSASAAAAIHTGADVILVDNAPGSFTPSIEQFVNAVTPRTKAAIVVDYAGIPYDSEGLIRALSEADLDFAESALGLGRPVVIADAAHSLGAIRRGRKAGNLADLTAFSFHAVKNLTTGEGGAVTWRRDLVADPEAFKKVLQVDSLHGQTKDAREKSQLGQWEYDIVSPGYKANLPDILASLGLSQLGRYEDIVQRRLEGISLYRQLLGPKVKVLDHQGPDFTSSGHLAVTSVPVEGVEQRDILIEILAERGIASNVHYKPLPMLTAYQNLGFSIEDFPNAYSSYASELTLPLFNAISGDQIERISEALTQAVGGLT